jgi:hypothetical protein
VRVWRREGGRGGDGKGNNCGGGLGEGAEDQGRELRLRERKLWYRIVEELGLFW